MDPSDPIPSAPGGEKPRRSCFGCLFTGTLGCGAFSLGVVFAAGLFAPSILGGFVAGGIERWAEGRLNGSIRIRDLELSWTDAQRANGLRLLDPDGVEILEGDLRIPSVFDMLDPDQTWAVELSIESADVRIGADGVSNLAFALGSEGEPWRGGVEGLSFGPFRSSRGFDQTFSYVLEVEGGAVRVTDARRPDLLVEIEGLQSALERSRGALPAFSLSCLVGDGEQRGTLTLAGAGWGPGADAPSVESWTLEVDGVQTALLDALCGAGDYNTRALGGRFGLSARVDGDTSVGAPLEVTLRGDAGTRFTLVGDLRSGRLVSEDGAGSGGRLVVPPELCEAPLAALLPAGVSLVRDEAHAAWQFTTDRFDLPLAWGTPEAFSLRALADGALFEGHAAPPGSFRLVDETDGELLTLRELDLRFGLGSEPSAVELEGAVVHAALEPGREVGFDLLVGFERGVAAAIEGGLDQASIEITAGAVPSALVDRVIEGDGLVAALFGDVVGVSFGNGGAAVGAPFELRLSGGPERELRDVRVEDGALVYSGPDTLELTLPWSELAVERVIRPLVPWMRDLSKPAGETFRLSIESLRLPLDRGWAGASGRIELRLGALSYRLHDGLHDIFHDRAPGAEVPIAQQRLLGIRMVLDEGVVEYEDLTLPVEGAEDGIDLPGSYDMESGELDLQAEVPVVVVRHRIGFTKDAEDFLQALGLSTEISVRGVWNAPRILIDGDAIRRFLEGSLEQLLQRANLETLFGGDDGE